MTVKTHRGNAAYVLITNLCFHSDQMGDFFLLLLFYILYFSDYRFASDMQRKIPLIISLNIQFKFLAMGPTK